MLGYADLQWQSVTTREMLPRPLLQTLAGGYRKIPVGQIGADIFCDSHSIASEIARLSQKPELALENCSEAVQAFTHRAELKVFIACLLASANGKVLAKAKSSLSWLDMARFAWDRILLGHDSVVKMSPKTAKLILAKHLDDVEGMLLTQDFLFGSTPNHADFAAYHSLWFARDLAEMSFHQHPKLSAWMDRIQAFGEGRREDISAQQALQLAQTNEPRPILQTQDEPLLGQIVSIAPADYGQLPTTGILVGSSQSTRIIASNDAETGTLHRHFPKAGFKLTPA